MISFECSCVGVVDHDYHQSTISSVDRLKEVDSISSIKKKTGLNATSSGNHAGSRRFFSTS